MIMRHAGILVGDDDVPARMVAKRKTDPYAAGVIWFKIKSKAYTYRTSLALVAPAANLRGQRAGV